MKANYNTIRGTLSIITIVMVGLLTHESLSAQNWFDTDWLYRRSVTISNPTSGILSDHQVQIKLDDNFDYLKTLANGGDILFHNG